MPAYYVEFKGEGQLRTIIISILLTFVISNDLYPQPEKILYSLQKKHPFSSSGQNDNFILTVRGKSLFTSTIYFEIRSSLGKVLYADQFSVDKFSEYGSTEREPDDSAKVMLRLAHLFDNDKFDKPAIRDTSEMDNNMLPKNIWWDVWLDKTAISFNYLISTENNRGIVYSKVKRKVIQYYICC